MLRSAVVRGFHRGAHPLRGLARAEQWSGQHDAGPRPAVAAFPRSMLQRTATCRNVLHHVATSYSYNTLQHRRACCNAPQHDVGRVPIGAAGLPPTLLPSAIRCQVRGRSHSDDRYMAVIWPLSADPPRAWLAYACGGDARCVQIGRNVFDGTVQRAVWEALGIDTSKLSVITLYRLRCGSRVRACGWGSNLSIGRPTPPRPWPLAADGPDRRALQEPLQHAPATGVRACCEGCSVRQGAQS